MLMVISPSKTLNLTRESDVEGNTRPIMQERAARLVKALAGFTPGELGRLLSVSDKLAAVSHEWFQDWDFEPDPRAEYQALLTFAGDVFLGMRLERFDASDFIYAQDHLRILSALYGSLRPLDKIQPYRLDMETKFAGDWGSDLYEFWGWAITTALKEALAAQALPVVINLASKEYFSAVDTNELGVPVITPAFLTMNRGEYRNVTFWTKRARGAMAAWIVLNRVDSPEDLREFDDLDCRYEPATSTSSEMVFLRDPA